MARHSLIVWRGQLNFFKMKTLGKTLAVAIIILGLGTSATFAGTPLVESASKELKVAFLPQHIDQMVVTFETTGDEVELNLRNEEGKFVHSEAVNGKGVFTKRYDLSELEKGIYSFEIRKGDTQYTKTVVLK
jgi:hypothetical protein